MKLPSDGSVEIGGDFWDQIGVMGGEAAGIEYVVKTGIESCEC